MVKYACVLILVLAFAAPAFAQDDYPQIEISLGYGNINLKDVQTGRHSGFTSHQAFNLSSKFAIENVLGFYGMGNINIPNFGPVKAQFISETFGGRMNYRTAGPVLYASAGLGGGWLRFPDLNAGSNSAFAFRFGGGVDVPINDYFDVKVDLSRHSYHFDGWNSGFNISTGIVFKISQ
jgi:hypothetical protein